MGPLLSSDGSFTVTEPDSTKPYNEIRDQSKKRSPINGSKRSPSIFGAFAAGCPALASSTGLADGLGPRVTLSASAEFAPGLGPPFSRSREIRRLRWTLPIGILRLYHDPGEKGAQSLLVFVFLAKAALKQFLQFAPVGLHVFSPTHVEAMIIRIAV